MKAVNTTPATRQVSNSRYTSERTLSERSARASIRARRDLRKATTGNDLSNADTDVVNGLSMIIGSILEDEGRNEREVVFDDRSYD